MKFITSDDGSITAHSDAYQQTYHSRFGALTESRQVYLQNSGVQERLESGKETRILEIGFGLGLNYLVTAACAQKTHTLMRYTGLENALLSPSDYHSLNYHKISEISKASLGLYEYLRAVATDSDCEHTSGDFVFLKIIQADATQTSLRELYYHVIYLDAFSPETNPELWTEKFMRKLFFSLQSGGILVSYCVSGKVRRSLSAAGFTVNKKPGPKGKREVLIAAKPFSPF